MNAVKFLSNIRCFSFLVKAWIGKYICDAALVLFRLTGSGSGGTAPAGNCSAVIVEELGPELDDDDICSFGDASFGNVVTAER